MLRFIYFLLALFLLCGVECDVVFNTSAPCMQNDNICNFNDGSIWNGGIVPTSDDIVTIQSDVYVTIILDTNTAQIVDGITISGNVVFQLFNTTLSLNSLNWTSPATVIFNHSYCDTNVVQGNDLFLYSASLDVYNSILLSTANIFQSSLFSYIRANISTLTAYGPDASVRSANLMVNTLYSYGNVSYSYLSVYHYAQFEDNLIGHLGSLYTFIRPVNIVFMNSQITITKVALYPRSNISVFGSEGNIPQCTFNTLSCSSECYLIVDHANASIGNSQYVTPVVGENVAINILSTVSFQRFVQTSESPCIITIRGGQLEILRELNIFAEIYLLGYAELLCSYPLTIEPTCLISGSGQITITNDVGYPASLDCAGTINVAQIELKAGNITAEEIYVQNLAISSKYKNDRRFIFGDLLVSGPTGINFEKTFLEVKGNYEQHSGGMTVQVDEIPEEPIFTVEGEISISNVSLSIHVTEGFYEKLLLAESTGEISAEFNTVTDSLVKVHKLDVEVEEDKIYVLTHEEGDLEWMAAHVIYFAAFSSIVAGLSLFMGCCIKKLSKKKDLPDPGDEIPAYISSLSFSRLGCCDGCLFIFFYGLLWIVVFEGAILTLALATLIPLGFIFGIIEHKFIRLWALIVFIVQIGGLLDLFADLLLMAKVSAYYFNGYIGGPQGEDDLDYLRGQELTLWATRFFLTLCSAVFGTWLTFTLLSKNGLGKLLDQMSGTTFWAINEHGFDMRATNGCILFLKLIVMALFWKVLMLGLRVYLIAAIFRSLIKRGCLTESLQHKIQWAESILYLDLMWSGIPLGILTMLELFLFSEDFAFGKEQVFELLKLGALGIDLIGASFLFFYIICGLIKKIPVLHHHDHHSGHKQLKEPLLGHIQE